MTTHSNQSNATSQCGYGSYFDNTHHKCIVIASPNQCEALYLYKLYDYIHLQLNWDTVPAPNDTNVRYLLSYTSQYEDTQNTVITESHLFTISDSFLNHHAANYSLYNNHTVAFVQSIFSYNTQTNHYALSSVSNHSTNCTLTIPASTTPIPTTTDLSHHAIFTFDGPFVNSSNSGQSHIVATYRNTSLLEYALHETFIRRTPFDQFAYDCSLYIHYCLNITNLAPTLQQNYLCQTYQDLFDGNDTVYLPVTDNTNFHRYHSDNQAITAISLSITNCSLMQQANNADYDCLIGHPQTVTLIADIKYGDTVSVALFALWWFWALLGFAAMIVCCLCTLFILMRRHKALQKKLVVARSELYCEEKELLYFDTNHVHKQNLHDMVKNPIGTGIPDSLPMLSSSISHEMKSRNQDLMHIRTDSDGVPFEYKISMRPKAKKDKHEKRKKQKSYPVKQSPYKNTDSSTSTDISMVQFDAKGRKKNQNWRTSFEEPLLQ